MSTTYTEYYNLGKQEDTSDKFDMSVITADMDAIDTALHNNAVAIATVKADISSTVITDTVLEDITDAVLVGTIDSSIHGTFDTPGIVRSYTLDDTESAEVYMQIAEFIDGTRKTRSYSSGTWSAWT